MDRLQVKMEIDRLNQEINELKAENAELKLRLELSQPLYSRRKLEAENARYRMALEFYAVNTNWYLLENTHSIITDEDLDDLNADPCLGIKLMGGRRAREALKGE